MSDVLLRALAAGLAVAGVMGPLGVFVVWRRMAYFGDALSHSALLGVALGIVLGISATVGIAAVCLVLAMLMVSLRRRGQLAEDTLLGILAHSALAFGMIAISQVQGLRADLFGYLFGDMLAISPAELMGIGAGSAAALASVALLWRSLIAITVHEELARVEGVKVERTQAAFILLIAIVIALAMKAVGVLLVTSLLIIPAAAARRLSRTPEQMAAGAALAGGLAVAIGLYASVLWDLPTGPAIVAASAALFALATALGPRLFGIR